MNVLVGRANVPVSRRKMFPAKQSPFSAMITWVFVCLLRTSTPTAREDARPPGIRVHWRPFAVSFLRCFRPDLLTANGRESTRMKKGRRWRALGTHRASVRQARNRLRDAIPLAPLAFFAVNLSPASLRLLIFGNLRAHRRLGLGKE